MKTLQKQNDCYSSDSDSDTESGSDSTPPSAPTNTSRSKKKEYEEIVEIPKRKYIRKKPISEEDMKLKLVKARQAKAIKQAEKVPVKIIKIIKKDKAVKPDKPVATPRLAGSLCKPDKPEKVKPDKINKPQKETIINNYYYKQEEEKQQRKQEPQPIIQPQPQPRRRIIASFI